MRRKDKIEQYILSLFKKYETGEMIESTRSRYFKVNDKILRVSDHIGTNSSGCTSIIVPNYKKNKGQYIIHSHSNGGIVIMEYEEVKELVRTFIKMSSFLYDFGCDMSTFTVSKDELILYNRENKILEKENIELRNKLSSIEKCTDSKIFGTNITDLTEKQVSALKKTVAEFNKHNGNKK